MIKNKVSMVLWSVLIILCLASTSWAGSTYFRAMGGFSGGDFGADAFGLGLDDFDNETDNGYRVEGALGFKPHKGTSVYGEIEAGYTQATNSANLTGFGPPVIDLESKIDITTLMFNLGYDVQISQSLSAQLFAGAGAAHSELGLDVGGPFSTIKLDNIDGDTAFAWQVGGSGWFEIMSGVQAGVLAKYVDYGNHRTLPGIDYDYHSVDVLGGLKIYWN